MKFSIKDFFSKPDQIRRSHLLKKPLTEIFIFVQWKDNLLFIFPTSIQRVELILLFLRKIQPR